jgi:hypothetical protein
LSHCSVLFACLTLMTAELHALYVGGTIPVKEGVEGKLDAADSTSLVFKPDNGGGYLLPYSKVTASLTVSMLAVGSERL